MVNTLVIFAFAAVAEWIAATSTAPDPATRAYVAVQALFGLSFIFWLLCGQTRSSPGLALLRLKLVSAQNPAERPSLVTALLRPMPFFLIAALVIVPPVMIAPSFAAVRFILVLLGALFLGANATPIWTGNDRRSLLDKWLKVRVVRK